jgi:hypothetical protein
METIVGFPISATWINASLKSFLVGYAKVKTIQKMGKSDL